MNLEEKEELLTEFYRKHDISLATDLLDGYYIHDPLCIIESPSFPTVPELNTWVVDNIDTLERKLE